MGSEMCIRDSARVVDGFCLVSSDSDYTRLATRIRETGIFVMGIGEKKTPKPFVNACDCLLYTSDAADERSSVDLGGRRIIKQKTKKKKRRKKRRKFNIQPTSNEELTKRLRR